MRRLSLIAVVAMLAVLPASAQMRGGVRGAPAMGRSGFAGRVPVARTRGFVPSVRGGVRFGTFGGFGSFGRPVFFPGHFHRHHHFFFGSGFNSFFGFPYYTYPYYPGYYPLTSDYSYSSSQDSAQYAQSAMAQQINELSYEVQRLREEEADRAYASSQTAPTSSRGRENSQEPTKPTVLVFQDKHTQEVENYAIVGKTLWVFSEQRARKIPLVELDLPATVKANGERGVEFHVPAQ